MRLSSALRWTFLLVPLVSGAAWAQDAAESKQPAPPAPPEEPNAEASDSGQPEADAPGQSDQGGTVAPSQPGQEGAGAPESAQEDAGAVRGESQAEAEANAPGESDQGGAGLPDESAQERAPEASDHQNTGASFGSDAEEVNLQERGSAQGFDGEKRLGPGEDKPVGGRAEGRTVSSGNTHLRLINEGQTPEEMPVDYGAQIDPERVPYTYHQRHLDLMLGARMTWVSSAGFDPFSSGDVLPQLAVRVGGVVWQKERMSLAIAVDWAGGGANDRARGEPSSIAIHRVGAGAEGRWHVLNSLFGYVRVAPGLLYSRVSLGSGDSRLVGDDFDFSADGAAGLAYRFGGSPDGRKRSARLHVFAEGGYSLATKSDLALQTGEDGPPRSEPIDLGSVRAGGPFVTAGLALTY